MIWERHREELLLVVEHLVEIKTKNNIINPLILLGVVDCSQTGRNRRQTEASKDPVDQDEEKLEK